MNIHASAIATAGYIEPATTTGAIGPRWPPYTTAATPLAPNTPASRLTRVADPPANGRCRVTSAAAIASTNAVNRCGTIGQVPASSDVEMAMMYIAEKNRPDTSPSVTPTRDGIADRVATRSGTTPPTPTTMPSQPSDPGTSPRAAPYRTGTTVDTTAAIGAATPMLDSAYARHRVVERDRQRDARQRAEGDVLETRIAEQR